MPADILSEVESFRSLEQAMLWALPESRPLSCLTSSLRTSSPTTSSFAYRLKYSRLFLSSSAPSLIITGDERRPSFTSS